jgi:hypothetical protein
MVTSINRSFNFEVKYVVPPPGLRHDELLEHSDVLTLQCSSRLMTLNNVLYYNTTHYKSASMLLLLEHSDVFLSHELPSCIIHFFLKNITLHVTII